MRLSASCPARGTWIEIRIVTAYNAMLSRSCPARGTWIEMASRARVTGYVLVVPRKGHVD